MKRVLSTVLLGLSPLVAFAQRGPSRFDRPDSAAVVPGAKFAAGGFYRFWFGDTYRDLWMTRLKVEVLDLKRFDGGLRPVKEGGGLQSKSLRLANPDGKEYVFRLVTKFPTKRNKGPVIDDVFRDEGSAMLPLGAAMAATLLDAVGVLHVSPVAYVMPDDSALGEFRKDFGGKLGMIEEFPTVPKHAPGFAGAVEIIDSDTLLKRIDRDPREQVDARALLTARLMDMFMNDIDRHPGQWKWARMAGKPRGPWVPIPRDRDQAFISFDGAAIRLARFGAPNLLPFRGEEPRVSGLSVGVAELDRRLLGGLEKPVWDSIAASLVRRLTDSVIDAAVRELPPEFDKTEPQFKTVLKGRRNMIPAAANDFYHRLALTADVHATDADDRLTVTRVDDRFVDVKLGAPDGATYFQRRFDANDTREIRIYLHGGADSALVTGRVASSIRVRVIGGNGKNTLVDSSSVGGSHGLTNLYDQGDVKAVSYGLDTSFHRVPWVGEHGTVVPPGPDRGGKIAPSVGLRLDRNLRAIPRLSFNRYAYGFGKYPYASRVGLDMEYSTGISGVRLGFTGDRRFELSPMHITWRVRYSELELLNYHGLGNDTQGPDSSFIPVKQKQWLVDPALAFTLGASSEFSIGPVFQVAKSVIEPAPGVRPYGFGDFAQLGFRTTLHTEMRDRIVKPHRRYVLDVGGAYTPAMLDVTAPFEEVNALGGAYFVLPIPWRPLLAFRAGGKKLFGDFPFQQAAFIGGGTTVRSLANQRFAGDASLYGTTELRVRVASFNLFVPVDLGVVGLVDAGKVYLDGNSAGGWHMAEGGGLWVSLMHRPTTFSVASVSGRIRVGTLINTGLSFDKR